MHYNFIFMRYNFDLKRHILSASWSKIIGAQIASLYNELLHKS